ncbi:hypothetical protein DQQ10_21475 [Pseudochryseolinea flava]|uniref:Uncharacterized protein n=1 Tax=Pseudochryseolinea flava TaxID=2059302 RepID=A0A364XX93_9BACT|nr:hypothetical protein DQQ10_21475 [Pseudochryseolinea flava]
MENSDGRFRGVRELTLLPDDIGEVMTPSDCAKAFDYLEGVLHISRNWRMDFEQEFLAQPHAVSKQEFFIRFTAKHIDPHLCVLLQRKQSPVQSLLRFLLRDRIAQKKTKGIGRPNDYYLNLLEKRRKTQR